MKKSMFLILFTIIPFLAFGQNDEEYALRNISKQNKELEKPELSDYPKNYVSLMYPISTISTHNGDAFYSTAGVGLNFGRTFFLHSDYLHDQWAWGIDVTWINAECMAFKVDNRYLNTNVLDTYWQLNLGMQVGPLLLFRINDAFSLNAFLRYSPHYSMFTGKESLYGSWCNGFASGINLFYKNWGFGIGYRTGDNMYHLLSEKTAHPFFELISQKPVRKNEFDFTVSFRF